MTKETESEQVALMPVERSYDVRAKQIIAFNECRNAGGDLDDALDAAYKVALRYTPAPVAVVPDLAELREYHANAVKDLEHYADDWNLRESDVKNYRKRAEFHRRQVALLDSLNPIKP
ncbi:hypothetical protein [Pseudomonas sp. ZS001]|uniref:hypothetical protein n=1 Tax=Pseudomonas sp. ZS001 TaxID=3138070 RepID=UPI00313A1913